MRVVGGRSRPRRGLGVRKGGGLLPVAQTSNETRCVRRGMNDELSAVTRPVWACSRRAQLPWHAESQTYRTQPFSNADIVTFIPHAQPVQSDAYLGAVRLPSSAILASNLASAAGRRVLSTVLLPAAPPAAPRRQTDGHERAPDCSNRRRAGRYWTRG